MRTLAIGDIHGCLASFDALLQFARVTTTDTVVTLGDYVDRGPDSKGVLDRLLMLHERGKLVSLRGNHEVMMLAARDSRSDLKSFLTFGGTETLESYRENGRHVSLADVPEKHWHFIEKTCRDYFETDGFAFVHANLNPELPFDKQTEADLRWNVLDPNAFKPHSSGKTMVCGHTEQRSGVPLAIPGAICIDTWAYGDGWLTCLDVDTGQYWQADELGRTREGRL